MTIRPLLAGCASLIVFAAVPAQGQSTDPTPPADAQTTTTAPDATASDDIVVTAQLVAQDRIEVPFALTAYSGKFLDDLGITEFDRLSRYVPGLVVQNQSPNNPGFAIRGLTVDSGASFEEPRVSVFQDGVSISRNRGTYVQLFDLERVEVAKGPQTTLYGRGALIGAINIISAKADPSQYQGYFYGSYGNYNSYRLDGTANIPLADDLAIRIAGRSTRRDGYVDNLLTGYGEDAYNGQRSDAIRGSVRYAPGRLTIDVIGNYERDVTTGTSFKSIAYDPTDPTTGAVIGNRGRYSGAALAATPGFEGDRGLGLNRYVWSVTGIANYSITPALSFNLLGSYRKFSGEEVFDADGISLPVLTAAEDARGRQATGTARLTYRTDKVTAFAGGSYFFENGSQRTPAVFDERVLLARLTNALNGGGAIPGRPSFDPAPLGLFGNTAFTAQLLQGVAAARGVALPTAQALAIAANLQSAHLESSTNFSRTESFDLFGDVSFRPVKGLELGGGVRYTDDRKKTGFASSVASRSILGGFIGALGQPAATRAALLGALGVPGAATIPPSALFPVPLFGLGAQPTGANGTRYDQSFDDNGFTFRGFVRYELVPDRASIYANYARGRRPKVLGVSPPAAPGGAPTFNLLPNEEVDSYEAGFKTALAGKTLFLDGAAYLYNYRNFQTTEQIGTTFITTNAGKARSYGFEGQLRWTPQPWVTVFGTYAYNHGRFRSGARAGNQFRLAPDNAASGGFTLKAPVGSWQIDFSPSVTYQSKTFFDDDNDRADLQANGLIPDTILDEFQKGYALVDARLGFEPGDKRFRIEGFVTNLFNKKFIKDAGNTGDALGLTTFISGEPRFYGVSISFRASKPR